MKNKYPLKILALGGLGEIGMNCLVLETEKEMIIIDCGVMFSDLDHFGIEYVIPDFSYVVERKEKLKAFLITHGHEDHIGALSYAFKAGLHVPIYASPLTSLMIRERMKEHGFETRADIRVLEIEEKLAFKDFKITAYPVTHSIVESAAYFVETPAGLVIHTGDFKIDPDPVYGKPFDSKPFKEAGDKGVLLLLSDSTNVERCEHGKSEGTLYEKFEKLFADMDGLCMVAMFSSNIGRMSQVLKLAKKMGKRVALAGRSMQSNTRLAIEEGYLKGAHEVIIDLEDIDQHARRDVIILSGGTQAEPGSGLSRAAHGDHRLIELGPGDKVVMSSREIPGNEKGISRMINQLYKRGADVIYDAIESVHVSGHASKPELELMLKWTRPKFFVPIHGEYRHLVHHERLALETGVKKGHSMVISNGDQIGINDHEMALIDQFEEEPKVWIEGGSFMPMNKTVLKERRRLAERGVISATLVREARTGRIVGGPELLAKGIATQEYEEWVLEEARKRVLDVIRKYHKNLKVRGPEMDLTEEIRLEIRRFVADNMGHKPVTLPLVLDID